MRKALVSLFSLLAAFTVMISAMTAQAAGPSPTAAGIFKTLGGTVTIDDGGAIHSQARSIYSLGGGQVSFQGKKVSLLSADAPSFSAGCSGISWHFGGFAFISLDEIRQLVEAVAQASLGVAVDLAMQTLCPQCYAVMAKLRDIANQMRNAGADACQVAQNLGRSLMQEMGVAPATSRKSDCSKYEASDGKTGSWMEGIAGQSCRLLTSAETKLSAAGDKINDWLQGGSNAVSQTPSVEQLELTGNVTYQALTALGYEDGFVKDMMLSTLGMTVMYAKPSMDCREAFGGLQVSDSTSAGFENTEQGAGAREVVGSVDPRDPTSPTNAAGTPAKAAPGGATTGNTICTAPPIITGIVDLGEKIICGFNADAEGRRFALTHLGPNEAEAMAKLKASSLGAMCLASANNKDNQDPWMYSCRGSQTRKANGTDATLDCTKPVSVRASQLMNAAANDEGYTGLAWMIGDALYRGVKRVRNNQPLDADTIGILNGSGYPLYRILNMAAVYPDSAGELLEIYAFTIATHYAMDTMTKVAQVGAQPTIDMRIGRSVRPETLSRIREQIMQMVNVGIERKSQALTRLAEKRTLVDHIVQVNRALQAEVISQGLTGNSDLAVSIKRQATSAN